jgi:thioredoxin-like negative regulator of GroEL
MKREICKFGSLNEYNVFVSTHKYVIIKAEAKWCGPCHRIKELFNSLVYKMPNEFAVGLFDIDDVPCIKRKLHINAVPFIANVIDGEVMDVMIGGDEKQIHDLFKKCKNRLEI